MSTIFFNFITFLYDVRDFPKMLIIPRPLPPSHQYVPIASKIDQA